MYNCALGVGICIAYIVGGLSVHLGGILVRLVFTLRWSESWHAVMALSLESFLILGVYVVSHSAVALRVSRCERDRAAAFFTSPIHCVSSM